MLISSCHICIRVYVDQEQTMRYSSFIYQIPWAVLLQKFSHASWELICFNFTDGEIFLYWFVLCFYCSSLFLTIFIWISRHKIPFILSERHFSPTSLQRTDVCLINVNNWKIILRETTSNRCFSFHAKL